MKKILPLVAAMVTCLSGWAAGEYAESFGGGTGTADNPYQVATMQHLANMAILSQLQTDFAGTYFVMTADIPFSDYDAWNMAWGIGQGNRMFAGTFDGQGHKITGFAGNYNPVFLWTGPTSVVKNLTMEGVTVTGGTMIQNNTAPMFDHVQGLVENCHVTGIIHDYAATGQIYCVAGLVGYLTQTGVVRGCSTSGTAVTACNYGGVVAKNYGGKVENCTSNMDITIARTGIAVGGIGADSRRFNNGAAINYQNCTFTGTIRQGQLYDGNKVGGISGDGTAAVIVGCANRGTIVAMGYVGGIAGAMMGGSVTESYNTGEVQDYFMAQGTRSASYGMSDYIAGICGQQSGGAVERCFNGGTVRSVRAAAGIVGCQGGAGAGVTTIADCYNAGLIDAPAVWKTGTTTIQKAGGIVAEYSGVYSLTIERCLSLGTINNAVAARYPDCEYVGYKMSSQALNLTGNYYDNQVAGNTSAQGSLTTAALTSGDALEGFSTDVWQFTPGMYPRLKCTAQTPAALLCATPYFLATGENHTKVKSDFTVSEANGVAWSLSQSNYATLAAGTVTVTPGTQAQTVTITSSLDGYNHESLLTIYPDMFAGNGTADNPYLINDYADMVRLSQATNEGGLTFDGDYIRLTADIDMQSNDQFGLMSLSEATPFLGTFDGDGHALNNLYMRNDLTQTQYGALFGYVGEKGVIRNLTIGRDSNIGLYLYGGTVASVLQGTIRDVKVLTRTINSAAGNGEFGGLVYEIQSTGQVIDCYVGAQIALTGAAKYVGGIARRNYGRVDGCQFAGNVGGATVQYVGGLVSENYGTIDNCLASGDVTALAYAGAVASRCLPYGNQIPAISRTLATGQVSYSALVECAGAVVGEGNATYDHTWYDKQIGLLDNIVADGLEAKSTTEIITGWGGGDKWVKDSTTYPMLAKFAAQPLAQLYSFPVTFAQGESRGDLITGATVHTTAGLTTRLDDGDDFALRAGKVTPDVGSTYGYDDLLMTYDGFTRRLTIAAYGKQMATGDGTAQNPWIINTAADLVKLATQSNRDLTIKHYTGKHFKLGADITLTGTFAGITGALNGTNAASTPRWFRGVIDGDGHSISGLNITSTYTNGLTGLVGYLGRDGVIKNLTIAGGQVQGTRLVGAVVGKCDGTVQNVTNHAGVTASVANDSYGSGGVIGMATANAQADNLTNYGLVRNTAASGLAATGGVIGYAAGDGTQTFTHLVNRGNVEGPMMVAGVVAKSKQVNYDDVTNYGTVTGTAATSNINGGCFGDLVSTASINNARNYGDVSGSTGVGGVIARYITGPGQVHVPMQVTGSLNAGNITGKLSNVGGIVGMSDTTRIVIDGCANVGRITNTAATIAAGTPAAGGIVGGGSPIIRDCYNAGVIAGANCIGGLLGRPVNNGAKVDIIRSVNVGWLEGYAQASANVGSVTGYNSTAATYSDVTYDNQMSDIAGAARTDADGITGLATAQLLNEQGLYPTPATLVPDSALTVASVPVLLHSGDTRLHVTRGFGLGTVAGLQWHGDSVFTIAGTEVTIRPYTHDTYYIKATYGTHSRVIPLAVDFDTLPGDVNGDGVVDVADVNLLINIMLGKAEPTAAADINGDGQVDVTDINLVINIMLKK